MTFFCFSQQILKERLLENTQDGWVNNSCSRISTEQLRFRAFWRTKLGLSFFNYCNIAPLALQIFNVVEKYDRTLNTKDLLFHVRQIVCENFMFFSLLPRILSNEKCVPICDKRNTCIEYASKVVPVYSICYCLDPTEFSLLSREN